MDCNKPCTNSLKTASVQLHWCLKSELCTVKVTANAQILSSIVNTGSKGRATEVSLFLETFSCIFVQGRKGPIVPFLTRQTQSRSSGRINDANIGTQSIANSRIVRVGAVTVGGYIDTIYYTVQNYSVGTWSDPLIHFFTRSDPSFLI